MALQNMPQHNLYITQTREPEQLSTKSATKLAQEGMMYDNYITWNVECCVISGLTNSTFGEAVYCSWLPCAGGGSGCGGTES